MPKATQRSDQGGISFRVFSSLIEGMMAKESAEEDNKIFAGIAETIGRRVRQATMMISNLSALAGWRTKSTSSRGYICSREGGRLLGDGLLSAIRSAMKKAIVEKRIFREEDINKLSFERPGSARVFSGEEKQSGAAPFEPINRQIPAKDPDCER